ncbi:MAG: ABC transporter substrate-binding protein, partial [Actinomycetota bacterium]
TVAHHLAFGDVVDADLIASWGTDLVLISPNHAAERTLSAELADGDIPVLVMPNSWDDLDDVRTNIELIGEALGTDADAVRIVEELERREAAVAGAIGEVDDPPVVLIMTNVAQVPFLVGPGTSTDDLVTTAGGVNAARQLGVTTSIGGINAAQIVEAAPDAILLVDGLGTGRAAFAELLSSTDVTEVPAVAADRILVLPARDSFGTAHRLVDGLEAIAEWLHPTAG